MPIDFYYVLKERILMLINVSISFLFYVQVNYCMFELPLLFLVIVLQLL